MSESPPTIVRQSARHDVVLRATLSVAPAHAGLVKFSAGAGARDGWIETDLIDISGGGFGLMTRLFVPRRTLARVRVYGMAEGAEPVLECTARIQRVLMTDRRPAYLLGTSFEALTSAEAAALDELLGQLNAE